MSKYIIDIHGELEGDYEIIRKYEEPTTKLPADNLQQSVLDKIRAEILEEHENAYAREDDDTAYGLSMALDILDKYTAESEGEELIDKVEKED